MDKLLSNIHYFVIILLGMGVFNSYTAHQERMELANGELSSIEINLQKVKVEVKSLEAYGNDIEKAKADLELARDAIERMQKQLPSEVSNTENLEILSRITTALNIKDVSLTPGAEEDKGFYIAKEYSLRAKGTFLQFLIFFERLTREQRLFNIKSILLTLGNHRQKGRFQIIDGEIRIEAYRYNTNHKETTGLEEIEKELKQEKPAKRKRKNKGAEGGEE